MSLTERDAALPLVSNSFVLAAVEKVK